MTETADKLVEETHRAVGRAMFESDRDAHMLDSSKDIEEQWREWEDHYTRLAAVSMAAMTEHVIQRPSQFGWEEEPPRGLAKALYRTADFLYVLIHGPLYKLGEWAARRRWEREQARDSGAA